MKLVSKFDTRNVTQVGNLRDFLDEDTMRRMVPSIYAPHAHPDRSERYLFIPTRDIVDGLEREGFLPVFAAQANPRRTDKRGFTKHLLRFRREIDIYGKGDAVPEIVLLNSHGGESRLQMFCGLFRFLCLNSAVMGETFEDIKVRHTGKLVDDVLEGAHRLTGHFGEVMSTVEDWRHINLNRDEQRALAQSASVLRLGEPVEGEAQRLIDPEEFNTVRREEDNAPRPVDHL